jgi:hypothetical protein
MNIIGCLIRPPPGNIAGGRDVGSMSRDQRALLSATISDSSSRASTRPAAPQRRERSAALYRRVGTAKSVRLSAARSPPWA